MEVTREEVLREAPGLGQVGEGDGILDRTVPGGGDLGAEDTSTRQQATRNEVNNLLAI